ncbi:MAG: 30S ribosomal protein S1 [Nitrospirae bacterium]|nr:30S ribosomal protein S1 [Nitrospirota bacterium]
MIDSTDEEIEDGGEFDGLFEESLRALSSGTLVDGVVVAAGASGVVVDIGYKSEGVIPPDEFADSELAALKPGDVISVFITRINQGEGVVYLSKRRADALRVWDRLEAAAESGLPVEGVIDGIIKGGMSVRMEGETVFLPSSHIGLRPVRNPEEMIGTVSFFKVLKVNKRRRNAIVSRKLYLEDELKEKRRQTLERLTKGAVIDGTVKSLTDYGVFVDLGGIDGLLHVSDISWGRISNPAERFSPGNSLQVVVLDFDAEAGKVTLGHKQLKPDPWSLANERYSIGDIVSGKVMGLTEYGAFVEIEEGVEGLVHVSELRWGSRPKSAAELLSRGQVINAVILKVDTQERRISLSIKRLSPNPWEAVAQRFRPGQLVSGEVRNLTDFGAFVRIEDGIDGLVHVSDMSWTKHVRHPSEIVRKGDVVDAVVLAIDAARERMSLGIKQLGPDPWLEGITQRFRVGDIVAGSVIKVVEFGIFVELDGGMEGLVYASEISGDDAMEIRGKARPGDGIKVKIIKVDTHERKIGLSLHGVPQ